MCGAPQQGSDRNLDATTGTVIQGVVTVGGEPVPSAYVRLLDGTGEFTAEVVSSETGRFRFFAAPGHWTLRGLSTRGNGEVSFTADTGVTDATLALSR
ncbi:MAG: DUF1416 domain-containing protein [Pseudonocardiales bacterium]